MNSADKTIELLTALLNSKKHLAETLVEKGEEASVNDPFDTLTDKAGNYIPKSYIFVDEEGNEVAGTLVEQETVFDATENDVRAGKVFATNTGVKVGTKVIPACHTSEGKKFIQSGKTYTITFGDELFDFTKFQAIICPFNSSLANSVAAEKVAIDEGVYEANSTELLATITRDSENKSINLGITNDSESLYVLRYITYKEIY